MITFAGEAERQNVELQFSMPPQIPTIFAEPESVNRVLAILLEDGLSRIPNQGWVRIELEVKQNTVQIHLIDNGEPYRVDSVEELFTPQILPNGEINMGLILARKIMAAHGGVLDVHRNADTTAFTLEFKQ